MSRSSFHISVPEEVRRYVESRVESAGYGTVSEYFRELIRSDRQRQLNRMQSLARSQPNNVPAFRPLASAVRRQK